MLLVDQVQLLSLPSRCAGIDGAAANELRSADSMPLVCYITKIAKQTDMAWATARLIIEAAAARIGAGRLVGWSIRLA